MKKICYLFLLYLLCSSFFQSKAANISAVSSGDWTSPSIWSSGSVPLAGDNVTINSGIVVTVSTDVSSNVYSGTLTITGNGSLVIAQNGKFSRTTGSITFSGSGAGSFLIAGTYFTTATSIPTFTNTSAKLQIQNGGILSSTASGSGGSIFGTTTSTNVIWDEGSIFELNGGSTAWNTNTFFPNNTTSTTTWPTLRLTAVGTFANGSTGTTVNGILHINGTTAATSISNANTVKATLKGGLIADFAFTTTINSSQWSITGNNAVIGGAGGYTSSGSGGLLIAAGASVTAISNTSLGLLNIAGSFMVASGVTVTSTQTTTCSGTAWSLANSGSLNFASLTIAGTPTTQPATSFSVSGILTVSASQTFAPTSGTITMSGVGSGITNSGTSLVFNNLIIASTPTAQSQYNSSYSVAGSLTVNNGVAFSPTSGTVTITGANMINNSNTAIGFANLIINSSGTTLSGSATVSGTLNLTNGILTTSNANPSLLNVTGSISGGTTNTNFINGTLTRTLTNAVSSVFPVGNGGIALPFTIVPNGTPTITVAATNADAGVAAIFDAVYLTGISHSEYWNVTLNSGTLNAASVSAARQTSLAGLNTLAQSAAQNGSYANVGGSVSGNGINAASIATNLGFFTFATLNLAPSIFSFSSSSPSGGTSGYQGSMVTLTGYNFTGTTNVAFGGKAADSFAVINNTTIRAYVGSGNSGNISVTTNNGTALSTTPFTYLGNNPNFLIDGDFELSTTGTSSNVSTGGGTINNTLAGQWQTTFQSPSSSGTSNIVDTTASSGSKSIAITITSHTNRNDIKLIQVIPNTTIPPATTCVLTFYMRAARTGDSVVANLFKSTTASNSNGVSGDATQPANLFFTTTYWNQYKMYVDLTGWSIAERTNMRLSIRPNSTTSTVTPKGPFPKTYFFDNISFMVVDTLKEMKDIALQVATDRWRTTLDSGFTTLANKLSSQITTLQNATVSYPSVPANSLGFSPPLAITGNANPYIVALNKWGDSILNLSFNVQYPKSKRGKILFTDGPDCRDLGDMANNIYWLLLSPESKFRYSAELFRRYLTILYALADDYIQNGNTSASGTPGSTANGMNDWFAGLKISYAWWKAHQTFSNFVPDTLRQSFANASDTMGNTFYNVAVPAFSSGNYTNRDISYATILYNTGLFRNNTTWVTLAKRMVDSINLFARYPDGAYSYLGYQNETANYHGGTNNSLAHIWVISGGLNGGYQPAKECISKVSNYEILSIEPTNVSEFYTAAAWKSQWNGSTGYSSEAVNYFSKSPYFKTKLDQINAVQGYTNDMVTSVALYNTDVVGKPLPDNYLVYDRNIQGPRARYGRFSYAASLRNTAPVSFPLNTGGTVGNLGMPTFVGAMITEPWATNANDIQKCALIRANTLVHITTGSIISPKVVTPDSIVQLNMTDWGFMMTNINPKTCVSRIASSFSSPAQLQSQYSGPVARLRAWSTNQHWITLPDRLIGYVETYPTSSTGTTKATQITGRVRFTYGNNGILDPQQIKVDIPNQQYTYGDFTTIVKAHNYNSIDTAMAGGASGDGDPFNATDIIFICDSSNNGAALYNYSGSLKKYYMVEIQKAGAAGTSTVSKINNGLLSGIQVSLNGNIYTSLRNDSTGAMTLNLSNYMAAGNVHQVHYSRNDTTRIQPITITSSSFSLPASEQILLVSSSSASDLGKGWENFDTTLAYTGIFPAASTTNWTGGFNTDFTHFGNWDAGVPNDSTNAIIYNVPKQPVINTNQSAKAFRLITGAAVTNNAILSIKDTLTNRGTIAGTGTVSLTGTNNQKIIGIGTINNLALNNPAGATISTGSNMTSLTGVLSLNSGTLTTNGNLTLKSSSTATASIAPIASGAGISGNITVERFIPAKTARKYSLISSPVAQRIDSAWQQQMFVTGKGTGGSICGTKNSNGFDATTTNTASLFTYSPQLINGGRWTSVPTTNATFLTNGVGYRANIRGSRSNGGGCQNQLNNANPAAPDSVVLSATGPYIPNPIASVTGTTTYSGNRAYTLLGNPYPSPISATAFLAANSGVISNNIWLYANNSNPSGNYGVWNRATKISSGYWPADFSADNPTDLIIPSGAAFFVERLAATDSQVVFTESQKTGGTKNSTTVFGGPVAWNNKLICSLQNRDSSAIDQAVLLLGNAFSDTSYTGYDAFALNTDNPQYCALLKSGLPLSLSAVPVPNLAKTLPMKTKVAGPGSYRFSFSGQSDFPASLPVSLKDGYLGKVIDLKSSANYVFAVTADTASAYPDRFSLLLSPSVPLANDPAVLLKASVAKETVVLSWNRTQIKTPQKLERSKDGKIFTAIDLDLNAQSENVKAMDGPGEGKFWYRVATVGSRLGDRYSNTVAVVVESGPHSVSLSPNPIPANELAKIKVTGLPNGRFRYGCYGANGQLVASNGLESLNGSASFSLPKALSVGAYRLVFTGRNGATWQASLNVVGNQ